MNKSYPYIIGRFLVLVAVQVLLIDHINLGGYINPPLYVLFILLLPFQTPGWLLLISSFLLGFSIDIFSNSMGIHSAASVFLAFMRPFVIKGVGAPAEYEGDLNPGIPDMGIKWFILYSTLLVLVHQLMIGMLETFRLAEIGMIFVRLILSTVVTVVLIVLVEYLFMNRRK